MGYLITDAQTDGQTDRPTKEKTDGRTNSKTHEVKNQLYYLYLCILVVNGIFYGKLVGSSVENDHL